MRSRKYRLSSPGVGKSASRPNISKSSDFILISANKPGPSPGTNSTRISISLSGRKCGVKIEPNNDSLTDVIPQTERFNRFARDRASNSGQWRSHHRYYHIRVGGRDFLMDLAYRVASTEMAGSATSI